MTMKTNPSPEVSRRHFITLSVVAATGVWLMPRRLFAAAESPVITIRNAAASAKITVTKLRGNVSVLEGSGGNIAVLTGRDGKLLIDAGIPGTRARITDALDTLSGDPVKHFEFRDMLVMIREKIAVLKKQGKSRDEVVAAKPRPTTTRNGAAS
jgi:hypothetical protein